MRKELGTAGEQLVADRLQQKGFTILARNYRKRYGEIDLIATKDQLLLFIEVKTRRHHSVDLAEVILPSKQRKIALVANAFLAEHTYNNHVCRFDVALVEQLGEKPHIQYIADAFSTMFEG